MRARFVPTPPRWRSLAPVLFLLGSLCFFGAAAPTFAAPQLFTVTDFAFEDGTALPDMHIAYDTQGTLSAARDNAILLIPGAVADRHAFDPLIGPGKLFDTGKYFVILADPLGGGESTSPADGMGQEFPRYTIRDMMEAEQQLVTRGLGIPRLRVLVGSSMGSFVALEWGIHHPESAAALILLAPSPRADPTFRLITDLIGATVALDPEWQGGRYTHNPVEGLRHAGMLFYPWVVSSAYINRTAAGNVPRELEASAAAYAEWDANALMLRFGAYRAHDVAQPYKGDLQAALGRVAARTLIFACNGDRLIGSADARQVRDGLAHAAYVEIDSDLGHRAMRAVPGTPEGDEIARHIRAFLGGIENSASN